MLPITALRLESTVGPVHPAFEVHLWGNSNINEAFVFYHAAPEGMKEANMTDSTTESKKKGSVAIVISIQARVTKLELFIVGVKDVVIVNTVIQLFFFQRGGLGGTFSHHHWLGFFLCGTENARGSFYTHTHRTHTRATKASEMAFESPFISAQIRLLLKQMSPWGQRKEIMDFFFTTSARCPLPWQRVRTLSAKCSSDWTTNN